jgi:hypothetical protein
LNQLSRAAVKKVNLIDAIDVVSVKASKAEAWLKNNIFKSLKFINPV